MSQYYSLVAQKISKNWTIMKEPNFTSILSQLENNHNYYIFISQLLCIAICPILYKQLQNKSIILSIL